MPSLGSSVWRRSSATSRLRWPLVVLSLLSTSLAFGQEPAPTAPSQGSPEAPKGKAEKPSAAPAESATPTQKPANEGTESPAEATPVPAAEGTEAEPPTETEPEGEPPPTAQTEAPEPAAPPAQTPPPSAATEAAAAPVDPTATSTPAADDDYAGATDAALVEEKRGPKNLSLGVALDVTFPMGKSAEYIKSASIQGLSLDLRYYAWGNIGIGAGVALDSLSKKLTDTVTWGNATFTGTQVRELSFTPITLKGYYAWRDNERAVPYVAVGVGAARSVRRLVVGISGLSEAAWHLAMVPEAGLQIPVGPTLLLTNVRFNYLPASGGVEDQMFANFSVGLSIQ